VLFARQWEASGLRGRMPLIAGGTHTDEHVLPQLGDETIGVIGAHHYPAALDTPANRRFRAAFEKKYNRTPSFYSENCYTGARVVAEAAKAVTATPRRTSTSARSSASRASCRTPSSPPTRP